MHGHTESGVSWSERMEVAQDCVLGRLAISSVTPLARPLFRLLRQSSTTDVSIIAVPYPQLLSSAIAPTLIVSPHTHEFAPCSPDPRAELCCLEDLQDTAL